MHRELECGGFTGAYGNLNSLRTIKSTWLEITRHLISLEAEHLPPGSFARLAHYSGGLSLAWQLFDFQLRPRPGFWLRRSTRSGIAAYLGGEAFTRSFAERSIKASRTYQLDNAPWLAVSFGRQLLKTKPGLRASTKKKGKRHRPDFIAAKAKDWHLLEAKGSAGRVVHRSRVESQLSHGLTQVSRVLEVEGRAPVTRTACSFAFDSDGARGSVWDPPRDIDAFALAVDFPALVRQSYAVFSADAPVEETVAGFVGGTITPEFRLSVDRRILEHAMSVQTLEDVDQFHLMLDERREELLSSGTPSASVGPDGIRLDTSIEIPELTDG